MMTTRAILLFKQFFEVPRFEDETTYRRAQLLSFLINLHLVVATVTAILFSTVALSSYAFPVIALFSCLPALGTRWLIRTGRIMLAATIFIGMLALTMPVTAFLGKTSVGTVTVTGFQFLTIVMAGLLLGGKGALAILIFTALFNGFLLYAEFNQLYQARSAREPVALWVTQTITYSAAAALIWMANRLIKESLTRAARELAERRHADEREQHQREMLEKVIHLGKTVTEVADVRTVLRRIWDGVRSDLDFDRVGLFLYNATHNTMEGAYGTDRSGAFFEAWDVKFELDPQAFFYKVLSRPDGLFFTHDYEGVHNLPPDHAMAGVKHYAAVAAWTGDKPVAIICVDQLVSGRPITEEQVEALRLFAGYAGLAIENARLNSELERRVEERTVQLETANQELESFAYSVSHDLRAPLRAVAGFIRILNDNYASALGPEGQHYLQRVREGAHRMGDLIDDLLAFSRTTRQPIKARRLGVEELTTLVKSIASELRLSAPERTVEWNIAELPACHADPSLLNLVFINLLGNAFKYSRERDPARIEVGARQQNGEVVYFVKDNGTGFDMRYADNLFGVFQRLHREEEFEGTGIGLATAQRIIQRHGGRLWAEAEVDKGATFYFTLGSDM